MAPFAGDTQNEILSVVQMNARIRENSFEVRCVAFQTARNNRPFKVRLALDIAGTNDPSMQDRGVTHGQLKQLIVSPI